MVPTGIWPSSIALPGFTSIFLPAITRVAGGEPLRREDVGELAVLIFDQRDEGGAVRIIFEPLDGGRHVPLATLEVDIAVLLLVAAGDAARGDMALVVAAAGLALALDRAP